MNACTMQLLNAAKYKPTTCHACCLYCMRVSRMLLVLCVCVCVCHMQLFNAAKYMSAFPALMLTVLEHESVMKRQTFPHRSLWLTAMVFNTVYSYYWDVEMDWDMPWIYSWTKRTTSNGT